MTTILTLCATLAIATAQVQYRISPSLQMRLRRNNWDLDEPTKNGETVIENKNVNIIVNVDPREVAEELWQVIENHMNQAGRTMHHRRSSASRSQQATTRALEKVVKTLITPSRKRIQSVFDLTYDLEDIVRKALRNKVDPSIQTEELVKSIVADMMVTLRRLITPTVPVSTEIASRKSMRNADDEDEFFSIRVKIYKDDILNALQ